MIQERQGLMCSVASYGEGGAEGENAQRKGELRRNTAAKKIARRTF